MRFWKRNTLKVKRGPTLQMLPVGNLQSATTLRRSGRALTVYIRWGQCEKSLEVDY
jgi:hypothetical protein